jgi:hypothetical protein
VNTRRATTDMHLHAPHIPTSQQHHTTSERTEDQLSRNSNAHCNAAAHTHPQHRSICHHTKPLAACAQAQMLLNVRCTHDEARRIDGCMRANVMCRALHSN